MLSCTSVVACVSRATRFSCAVAYQMTIDSSTVSLIYCGVSIRQWGGGWIRCSLLPSICLISLISSLVCHQPDQRSTTPSQDWARKAWQLLLCPLFHSSVAEYGSCFEAIDRVSIFVLSGSRHGAGLCWAVCSWWRFLDYGEYHIAVGRDVNWLIIEYKQDRTYHIICTLWSGPTDFRRHWPKDKCLCTLLTINH